MASAPTAGAVWVRAQLARKGSHSSCLGSNSGISRKKSIGSQEIVDVEALVRQNNENVADLSFDLSCCIKPREDFPKGKKNIHTCNIDMAAQLQKQGIYMEESIRNGQIITQVTFSDWEDDSKLSKNSCVLKSQSPKMRSQTNSLQSRRNNAHSLCCPNANLLNENKFPESVVWLMRQNANYIISSNVIQDEMAKFINKIRFLIEIRTAHIQNVTDTIMLSPYSTIKSPEIESVHKRSWTVCPTETDSDNEIQIQKLKDPQSPVLWALQKASKFVRITSPLVGQLYFRLARIHFIAGRIKDAKLILSQTQQICVKVFTRHSEEYAITCWLLSNIELAEDNIEKAQKLSNLYYSLVGRIRFNEGNFKQTIHLLNQAIVSIEHEDTHPILIQNYFKLSSAYIKSGKSSASIPLLLKLEESFPKVSNTEPECDEIYEGFMKIPEEINMHRIRELLSEAFIADCEFTKAIGVLEQNLESVICSQGGCSSMVAAGLVELAAVYETKAKNFTETPLCDLADAVRFNIAAAYIYNVLSKTSHDAVNIIARAASLIHEATPEETIDSITARLNDVLSYVPEEEYLLGHNLRYSFLCICFPTEKLKIAMNENIPGAPSKKGLLYKRRKLLHNSVPRWVELHSNFFIQSTEEDGGEVNKQNISEITKFSVVKKTFIQIHWAKYQILLQCPNEEVTAEWIYSLEAACGFWTYQFPISTSLSASPKLFS